MKIMYRSRHNILVQVRNNQRDMITHVGDKDGIWFCDDVICELTDIVPLEYVVSNIVTFILISNGHVTVYKSNEPSSAYITPTPFKVLIDEGWLLWK